MRRPALTYALFTFLTCFLELGIVVDAVARGAVLSPVEGTGWSLWQLGALLLAFHAATLLTHLLTTRWPRVSLRTGPARLGSLAIGSLFLLAHPGGVVGTAMGVFLATLGLQHLRNNMKARTQLSVRYKALPRLAGFTLAFLYSPPAFATLSMLALGVYLFGFPINRSICFSQRSSQSETCAERTTLMSPGRSIRNLKSEIRNLKSPIRPYLTTAFHSAHYFAFGYGVPLLFAGRYGFPVASLGLVYTAGWIGYYLISRLLPPAPRYLAWGHLASALGILVLAFSPTPWPAPSTSSGLALLAWTITGFGGGTIFMLSRLRGANPYDPAAMDLWDNGANVVGLLLFLWAWGQGAPSMSFLAAAFLALVTVLVAAGLQEIPHKVAAGQLGGLVQS